MEVAYLDCTGHVFPKHAHDEFVIGANWIGRENIWLDGKSLQAATDDITQYNPGQLQAGGAASGQDARWAFVSVYVDPAILPGCFDVSAHAVFDAAVCTQPGLARSLRTAAAHSLRRDLSDSEAAESLLPVLSKIFTSASFGLQRAHTSARPALNPVADRLMAELNAPPSLSDLAAEQGLSPVQLVRAFTRQFGLPPFAWLMIERLKLARRLLATGQAVATISANLGFADQAHFTRRFKAMYGVPPAAWRRG